MKGRYYQAMTDDPMVDVITDQGSMREVMVPNLFERIESFGIDRARLDKAISSNDNWGALVHSFEYVTVLSVVLDLWPMTPAPPATGKFPMHEGGRS